MRIKTKKTNGRKIYLEGVGLCIKCRPASDTSLHDDIDRSKSFVFIVVVVVVDVGNGGSIVGPSSWVRGRVGVQKFDLYLGLVVVVVDLLSNRVQRATLYSDGLLLFLPPPPPPPPPDGTAAAAVEERVSRIVDRRMFYMY